MINNGYGYEYAAHIFDNHNRYDMNNDDYDERNVPETHVMAEKLLQKAVNIVFPKNEENEKSNYKKPKAPLRDFGISINILLYKIYIYIYIYIILKMLTYK